MSKVELFENERASGYNLFVQTWIPNYDYFMDCLPKVLRDINPKDLLVVGCGTGNEIERFVRTSEPWIITGIDPSPEMITQAKEKFQAYENVNLIEGLVSDLDKERKFSVATLLLVLHFMEDNGDKLSLLKSVSERLVSGAPFVILDITGDKNQIVENLKVLKNLLPDELEEEQISERLRRIQNELFPVSEERISELCVEAGFEKPLRFFQSSIYMGWMTRKK